MLDNISERFYETLGMSNDGKHSNDETIKALESIEWEVECELEELEKRVVEHAQKIKEIGGDICELKNLNGHVKTILSIKQNKREDKVYAKNVY